MEVSLAQIRAITGDVLDPDCPTREVLDHITSKWGVLVLLGLTEGTRRWSDLRRDVAGISEKMLASTLRTLENDGLVARHVHPQVPPRVDYDLTELGRDLMKRMLPLVLWVAQHADEIIDHASRSHQRDRPDTGETSSAPGHGRGRR
jgi:DNA-binding HxlR family transcriptional regulator